MAFCALRLILKRRLMDISDTDAYKALLDDLNTPMAISELHKLARELNSADAEISLLLRVDFWLLPVDGVVAAGCRAVVYSVSR